MIKILGFRYLLFDIDISYLMFKYSTPISNNYGYIMHPILEVKTVLLIAVVALKIFWSTDNNVIKLG